MRFATILTLLGFAVIGYVVGYLSGAIFGGLVWFKKFERQQEREEILRRLAEQIDAIEVDIEDL